MLKKLNKIAGIIYLDGLLARNYPEQEPEYKLAKWYDLLWLLIPIIGFLFFFGFISTRTFN